LMQEIFTKDKIVDFKTLFLVPCFASLVAATSLALFFDVPKKQQTTA